MHIPIYRQYLTGNRPAGFRGKKHRQRADVLGIHQCLQRLIRKTENLLFRDAAARDLRTSLKHPLGTFARHRPRGNGVHADAVLTQLD